MGQKVLVIVKLIEPEMCQECRFAKLADIQQPNGAYHRMIYCQRLDCDNWDRTGAERAGAMREIDV